jgi:hypothetical protein
MKIVLKLHRWKDLKTRLYGPEGSAERAELDREVQASIAHDQRPRAVKRTDRSERQRIERQPVRRPCV